MFETQYQVVSPVGRVLATTYKRDEAERVAQRYRAIYPEGLLQVRVR